MLLKVLSVLAVLAVAAALPQKPQKPTVDECLRSAFKKGVVKLHISDALTLLSQFEYIMIKDLLSEQNPRMLEENRLIHIDELRKLVKKVFASGERTRNTAASGPDDLSNTDDGTSVRKIF